MRQRIGRYAGLMVVLVASVLLCGPAAPAAAQTGTQPSERDLEAGKQLYMQRCAHCHGADGTGQGAAYEVVYPKPRDFTSGIYKFRTRHETADGNKLASDEDLFRSIAEGLHGTSMPGWSTFFTTQQMWQLVHYIKTFAEVYAEDKPGHEIDYSGDIASSPESIAKGKELFEGALECYTCHGMAGRGNGQQALDGLDDDWGQRIWPANLTRPWTYRGGHTRRDIFRNLVMGITGTPMPAFNDPDLMAEARRQTDAEEKQFLENLARETRENIWHTVNYVQSLWTHADEPEAEAVLTAVRVDGPLPLHPDDPAWQQVPVNYYPLVGQVIEEPRLFTPMVVGVEVQAVHNETHIAFRLIWDDRTPSTPGEADGTETYADAIALQFPSRPSEAGERPYFLMGDASYPTELWYWQNQAPEQVVRVQTTGYKSFAPGDQSGAIQASGLFDDGQYRLVLSRTLHTQPAAQETQFNVGAFLPFSVTVWDGSNGEHGGGKRAVMAWYNLYLEPEPSKAPIYLMVVGIVVGLMIEFSALYVTRKNRGQHRAVSETGDS